MLNTDVQNIRVFSRPLLVSVMGSFLPVKQAKSGKVYQNKQKYEDPCPKSCRVGRDHRKTPPRIPDPLISPLWPGSPSLSRGLLIGDLAHGLVELVGGHDPQTNKNLPSESLSCPGPGAPRPLKFLGLYILRNNWEMVARTGSGLQPDAALQATESETTTPNMPGV